MKTEQEIKYKQELKAIFVDNLYTFMAQKKLKQVDLAKIMGVSESTTSVWLNKGITKIPRMSSIDKLTEIFDCKRSDLLEKKVNVDNISRKELKYALFGGDISDEALEDVMKYAEYVKSKNNKD
jgi:DNA-binding Xre family transcriptional regulator